mmetsp:Transcript_52836/g.124055  ORF Transcript_52836/g.124055 Transcript_52836/m.124055 type:complete len:264 (-) Transcript_52836:183-974(-)
MDVKLDAVIHFLDLAVQAKLPFVKAVCAVHSEIEPVFALALAAVLLGNSDEIVPFYHFCFPICVHAVLLSRRVGAWTCALRREAICTKTTLDDSVVLRQFQAMRIGVALGAFLVPGEVRTPVAERHPGIRHVPWETHVAVQVCTRCDADEVALVCDHWQLSWICCLAPVVGHECTKFTLQSIRPVQNGARVFDPEPVGCDRIHMILSTCSDRTLQMLGQDLGVHILDRTGQVGNVIILHRMSVNCSSCHTSVNVERHGLVKHR